jgi:hypothetical protein
VGEAPLTLEGYLEALVHTRFADELEDRVAAARTEAKARGHIWGGDFVDEVGPTWDEG